MPNFEIGLLEQLERWYSAQCNGDWEHTYRITIETVDNPGWLLKIELTDTYLADQPFVEIYENRGDEKNQFLCTVRNQTFRGVCSPERLHEVISIFCVGLTTNAPNAVLATRRLRGSCNISNRPSARRAD